MIYDLDYLYISFLLQIIGTVILLKWAILFVCNLYLAQSKGLLFFKEQLYKSLCSSQCIYFNVSLYFLFLVTAFFLFMIKPKSFKFSLFKLKFETLLLMSILYKWLFKSFFNLQYHRFSYVFVLLLTNRFYLTFNDNR